MKGIKISLVTTFVFICWVIMPFLMIVGNFYYLWQKSKYFKLLKDGYVNSFTAYVELMSVDCDFKEYAKSKRKQYKETK